MSGSSIGDQLLASIFCCGPLRVTLRSQDAYLHDKITETLGLYDLTWPPPHRPINLSARRSSRLEPAASGTFLRCARMLVDSGPQVLSASTTSGVHASARLGEQGETWDIAVPNRVFEQGKLEEIEDILSLVLTTGWRRQGWTPIHAAAVENNTGCVVICAPTGGGKTTLTAALVRRGWRVLGDDKLLLRVQDGRAVIAALLHTFNLHPKAQEWFPEVGDLERLPRYSVWTEKRKVSISSIWSHAPAHMAEPSVLICLSRNDEALDAIISPLSDGQILETLLRQTVIPAERSTARDIISSVARAASQVKGLSVEVPREAYRAPAFLDALEQAIGGLI